MKLTIFLWKYYCAIQAEKWSNCTRLDEEERTEGKRKGRLVSLFHIRPRAPRWKEKEWRKIKKRMNEKKMWIEEKWSKCGQKRKQTEEKVKKKRSPFSHKFLSKIMGPQTSMEEALLKRVGMKKNWKSMNKKRKCGQKKSGQNVDKRESRQKRK